MPALRSRALLRDFGALAAGEAAHEPLATASSPQALPRLFWIYGKLLLQSVASVSLEILTSMIYC